MVLYIDPPRGRTQLSRLETLARTRLNFLLQVHGCHGNTMEMYDLVTDVGRVEAAADCLIEGSTKDIISHFILRLACSRRPDMCNFFIESETSFFYYRLSCMKEDEMMEFIMTPLLSLHTLLLHTPHLSPPSSTLLDLLDHVTCGGDLAGVVRGFLQGGDSPLLTLPYIHVLDLVASRRVTVRRGMAQVPANKLPYILKTVFKLLLTQGVDAAQRQAERVVEGDVRMRVLFTQLERIFSQKYGGSQSSGSPLGVIHAQDTDMWEAIFPLCMSNLHHKLRQDHRLKHHDRIEYSLYLKELGMPVHEALQFWRQEYSLPAASHGGQTWSTSGRRYTYNIRHLYGLEGSKVNYRGHSCTALQGRQLSVHEVGGCPFTNTDHTSLTRLLSQHHVSITTQAAIIKMLTSRDAVTTEDTMTSEDAVTSGNAMRACQLYQRDRLCHAVNTSGYYLLSRLPVTNRHCQQDGGEGTRGSGGDGTSGDMKAGKENRQEGFEQSDSDSDSLSIYSEELFDGEWEEDGEEEREGQEGGEAEQAEGENTRNDMIHSVSEVETGVFSFTEGAAKSPATLEGPEKTIRKRCQGENSNYTSPKKSRKHDDKCNIQVSGTSGFCVPDERGLHGRRQQEKVQLRAEEEQEDSSTKNVSEKHVKFTNMEEKSNDLITDQMEKVTFKKPSEYSVSFIALLRGLSRASSL